MAAVFVLLTPSLAGAGPRLSFAPSLAGAGPRLSFANPDLEAAVAGAVQDAEDRCRTDVLRDFRVKRQAITFTQGEAAVCRPTGAASYVRRSEPGRVYVCPAFLEESRGARVVTVLHEELHVAGVEEGHVNGRDDHGRLNARIVRVCFGGNR